MQTKLQLSFEGIDHSDAIESRVREEAQKLEQFNDHITTMRVVVDRPQHRHNKGDHYQVRIHITVPRAPDIVISREPPKADAHEDVYVAIRDAFKAARRQLRDVTERR
jgi:ribosomal subunit interface protein